MAMKEKETRATGAGSIAIGGCAKGATISTSVSAYDNADTNNPRSQGGKDNSVIAEGPGSIAVGDSVVNSQMTTNVRIDRVPDDCSGPDPDLVEFPRLATPVDVILRIAHAGLEEIRFDALA